MACLVTTGIVLTTPMWMPVVIGRRLGRRERYFLSCAQVLSLAPGLLGRSLRVGFYVMCLDHCGWDCNIGFGTVISHLGATIGAGVYIGHSCSVGVCAIGDRTLIGSNVDILSGRHHHVDGGSADLISRTTSLSQVRIGKDAWVGNSAVVMADVGDQTIIGAGSVVVRPIPAGMVAVGNPATVKKQRTASGEEVGEPRA